MAQKKFRVLLLLLALFALGSILLAACVRSGTASTSSAAPSPAPSSSNSCPTGNTVTTGPSNFEQSCITLSKGGTLKVTPGQGSTLHILDYGQWSGFTQRPATPANAPALKNLQVTSSTVSIGPFATAGTYHIYCTVHAGMNLTVNVR
jgi:plastocyanin